MTEIQKILFEYQDKEYGAFQVKLTPGISGDQVIGVRVPQCRALAKKLWKEKPEQTEAFLKELPHKYYDENMLHGLLLSEIKDFDKCVEQVEKFLPYVDNWAVCDIMSPKIFKKHKAEMLEIIRRWVKSEKTYTIRFGIEMLMRDFLDEHFKEEYLEIPASVKSTEYYVNMMIAWYFATALAKQWTAAFSYIEKNRLEKWTHNKTIQKAVESYRITDEQKELLRGNYKRNNRSKDIKI